MILSTTRKTADGDTGQETGVPDGFEPAKLWHSALRAFFIFDGMGDIRMEIANLVEITFHLVGRAPGLGGVVIDRLFAKGRVHPFPKLVVRPPL